MHGEEYKVYDWLQCALVTMCACLLTWNRVFGEHTRGRNVESQKLPRQSSAQVKYNNVTHKKYTQMMIKCYYEHGE